MGASCFTEAKHAGGGEGVSGKTAVEGLSPRAQGAGPGGQLQKVSARGSEEHLFPERKSCVGHSGMLGTGEERS